MKKTIAMIAATTITATMMLGTTAFADDKVYNIGICQLVQHVALDAASQGFMDALTEKLGEDRVNFDYQDASGESANCAQIANNFVAQNVDLILANATAPLAAAASATMDIPVLGTSITDYATALDIADWTGVTGYNVSGTTDLAPLSEQAAMINELFPASENPNCGIVYCSAEANSVYQATVVRAELEALGYTVSDYAFAETNDVATIVTNACEKEDVLYIPTDNAAASNTGIIDQIARPAGIPIIAGEEGICSGCGVATLSISYYDLGYTTGLMAYEILENGADITTMEVQSAPNVVKKYNKEICDELGVEIPEGYEAIG